MRHWSESFFTKAYKYYEIGNIYKAFEYFMRGAKVGNSSCMIWVGVLYGDKVFPDINNKSEIFWYKKAWSKRDLIAANNLAIVYRNQKKYALAERWFKIAIQNGDGDANLELAQMYMALKKHTNEAKQLLIATIKSENVTEASVEKANELLKEIT